MEFVAAPIGRFTFAVAFTAPVATFVEDRQDSPVVFDAVAIQAAGFWISAISCLDNAAFLRYTFSPAFLLELELRLVFAASFFATDDCG